jgi:uncharacterized membrane protein HdeD (DUF308 family)
MIEVISSRWWLFLLRGLAAIAVAVIAFVQPGAALIALVLVLGAFAFIAGVLAITTAAVGLGGTRWWAVMLEGIVGVVVALLIWSWPLVGALAFVYFVAGWLILTGIAQIIAGIHLRDFIANEWLYILTGIVSLLFGVWVFRSPAQGSLATAFLFGWYFLFFGVMQIMLAFRLRSVHAGLSKAAG